MCIVSVWHFIIVHSWIIQYLISENRFVTNTHICLVFLYIIWLSLHNCFCTLHIKFQVRIVWFVTCFVYVSYSHWFYIIRFSQRGQDECCMRGQWLSLSCQWELFVWMCVCFVVSYFILYFFSLFQYSGYSRHSRYSY